MKSDLRIVQLVTQREAAGAQMVSINLHEGFCRAGIESELWFFYRKRDCFTDVPRTRDFLPAPWTLKSIPLMLSKYTKALKRFAPNVIIAHTHYANVIGLPIARMCGIRRRIAVHHNAIHTYPMPARVLTRAFSNSQAAHSHVGVADHVCGSLNKGSAVRIYNGVAIPRAAILSRDEARVRLGIAQDEKLLVNVGRLSRQKNQSFLLRLLTNLPGHRLVIVGEGEDRLSLESAVRCLGLKDRVHFAGQLPAEMVRAWMSAADAFLFPSLFEAMPVALVEAMLVGVPIIASDIVAHREIAGSTITLLPLSEPSWLEYLTKPSVAKSDDAVLRASVFSPEAMVEEYVKLIKETL